MSVVEFIFREAGKVFNFTKDRLSLLVSQGNWKISTTYISCTPAANYFYYYEMRQSFLLETRGFSLYLFQWWHWEITSERLFNNISSGSSTIFLKNLIGIDSMQSWTATTRYGVTRKRNANRLRHTGNFHFFVQTQNTSFWIGVVWLLAFYTPRYPWVKFLICQLPVFGR